ncbi:MAG: hypothetical protein IJO45_02760 [Oscillospiraceae bacterium]|nr:hypothetical protein [Oscillospiraceae bacterium]
MRRTLMLLLALALTLGLCACGGDHVEETVAPPAEEIVETPAEEVTEAPTEAEPAGIVYTVNVVDEGGNPVVGTMVQICQGELCMMPCATDDSGVATFTVTDEGTYEAKLLSLPAGYEYATEEQVFPFGSAFELTITLKAVA